MSTCDRATIEFSGVRSSWLIFERNSVLSLLASSTLSLWFSSSVFCFWTLSLWCLSSRAWVISSSFWFSRSWFFSESSFASLLDSSSESMFEKAVFITGRTWFSIVATSTGYSVSVAREMMATVLLLTMTGMVMISLGTMSPMIVRMRTMDFSEMFLVTAISRVASTLPNSPSSLPAWNVSSEPMSRPIEVTWLNSRPSGRRFSSSISLRKIFSIR